MTYEIMLLDKKLLNSTYLVAVLSEGAYAPTLQGLDVAQVLLFLRLWK